MDLEELARVCASFAGKLVPGDMLLFCGELGSGKTTMIRFLCKNLGVAENAVRSPTFSLMHVYPSADGEIVHLDPYRLENGANLDELLEEQWFPRGIFMVEWPQRLLHQIEEVRALFELLLDPQDPNRRTLNIFE
ncbi:MAG TPA: tRNA (adenosine(37)-N6)-threonylcarbamoyltransferase complex ATPase subunit type 1 TsaE [Thermotogota bacterium]|nr:tRNA (adenosine(37)-N6)-threonylcarbamoyltransferase complex ATPase subunit type 1 TsaE [Thermotogota bacterium]HRW92180.1 tRNA (adenosine(37)-N6)-threonylcarbamoyltransferase complex ATPase subunit type 1 TsaE [Thermotogota bacterium]